MKKIIVLFLGVFLALTGCSTFSSSESSVSSNDSSSTESSSSESSSSSEVVMKESRLHIYSVPEGVNQYQDAFLFVGETQIDLMAVKVNLSQSWDGLAPNRVDNGVAILRLEGKATLTVRCDYPLSETFTTIRPKAAGISPTFNLAENSFSFTLSNTGKYTLEPNGDRSKNIHLFINSLEDDEIDKNAANVLYFGPGLHTAANDTRLAGDSIISLDSHQIVYLDYGAVVRGRFEAYNKTDIQIVGGGVIDGSTFPRIGQALAKTGMSAKDLSEFARAAEHTLILYDEKTKLYEQHQGFFDLPHIDPDSIPVEEFPLYAHWSYDRIYRNDLVKQPDVLMFMFLYSQDFSFEQKKANYEFYEPRCIHESSLSPSIHSIFASELRKEKEALDFFGFATRMDLDDYNRNAGEGLHTTSIAAAWMNIVYGFGGLRSDGVSITLSPTIPSIWTSYQFKINVQNQSIGVKVTHEEVLLTKTSTEPLDLRVYGRKYTFQQTLTITR